MNRREFLKKIAAVSAGLSVVVRRNLRAENTSGEKSILRVVHGKDVKKMVSAGIEAMGGWGKFVKKGVLATIKPNVAWDSTPEQGGNTHPDLVGTCVAACLSSGASRVVIPENTCSDHNASFKNSGIAEAVKKAGGTIYRPTDAAHFKNVEIQGKALKQADVAIDVLETGCLINMPVAKVHGGAKLTLSMKNWMGSVKDRGAWHRAKREVGGLHQCIADFSSFIKPSLIILDATRIMTTNGPRGPGKLEYPEQIIFGTDPVAVDAYATSLFGMEPFDVPYVRIAHEMGIGKGNLDEITINHIEV